MRPLSRATALSTSLIGLALAAILASCSSVGDERDSDGGAAGVASEESTAVPPAGDVPFTLVLPDDLAVSPDGAEVLASCWGGTCRWTTSDGALAPVEDGGHLAPSPDWSVIARLGDGATILLEDTASGDVLHELSGHVDEQVRDGAPIQDVAFSADGRLLASAGPGGEVIVWSTDDGSEIVRIEASADVARLAFSPDGRRLATVGDHPVEVFAVPSGDLVGTPADAGSGHTGLAWSADGRWLAGPGPDRAPTLWETTGFTRVDSLDGQRLRDLAFAPDSGLVAVTDTEDDTVRLWAPAALREGGPPTRDLVGHTDEPHAVVFSPDGSTLYSVAGLEGVLAWDVASGRLSRGFELPER